MSFHHEGKAVGVGDVPVESVQLHHAHAFDRSLDRLDREEISRCVQKEPAVFELWLVLD